MKTVKDKARALGGSVAPHATYRINETGEEFLTMGNSYGRIAPATSNRGGGVTIAPTIYVTVQGGTSSEVRAAAEAGARAALQEVVREMSSL